MVYYHINYQIACGMNILISIVLNNWLHKPKCWIETIIGF